MFPLRHDEAFAAVSMNSINIYHIYTLTHTSNHVILYPLVIVKLITTWYNSTGPLYKHMII